METFLINKTIFIFYLHYWFFNVLNVDKPFFLAILIFNLFIYVFFSCIKLIALSLIAVIVKDVFFIMPNNLNSGNHNHFLKFQMVLGKSFAPYYLPFSITKTLYAFSANCKADTDSPNSYPIIIYSYFFANYFL